ncbi:TetR/AcrR family transcriptional regulator [Streptomyces sp. NPDC052236]|uniref:TetR/AcrR family transcriptional regulator n=1 Tax=Streptomyces sp. NPDC052236 TaxID=3365686 RepID=UPI0037D548D9
MSPVADTAVRRHPRADALRNRERIVAAAREMFVEHGAEVPFDEIARRAGVGNATLYRHFPERSALIYEVILLVLSRTTERAHEAAAEEADAFAALRRFVHAAADERVGALCGLLSGSIGRDHPELELTAERARLDEAVQALFTRAQDEGRLRHDIAIGDLVIGLSQLTRPLPGTACMNLDRFVHRHLELFLDGLEAPARSTLPGSAVTMEDLRATT